MSKLTEFYLAKNDKTTYPSHISHISNIPYWGDITLEETHDYIQWIFPTNIPSQFNPDAPILTDEDIKVLRANPLFHSRVRGVYGRMMSFFSTVNWSIRNHNMLRVTRILTSLRLMGFESLSEDMYEFLLVMTAGHKIDKSVLTYWSTAMKTPVYIGE